MANLEVEKRADIFGKGTVTLAEQERLFRMRRDLGSWGDVKQVLNDGKLPAIQTSEFSNEDIYDAGAAAGCPWLISAKDINIYLPQTRAYRMITRVLKEGINEAEADLLKARGKKDEWNKNRFKKQIERSKLLLINWKADEPRRPGEIRIDSALEGTPENIRDFYPGVSKHLAFSLTYFFTLLTNAEQGIDGPVDLPKNKKLYLPREEYVKAARMAWNIKDLPSRLIAPTLKHMLDQGVSEDNAALLILEAFLPKSLLIEDNIWDRAIRSTQLLAFNIPGQLHGKRLKPVAKKIEWNILNRIGYARWMQLMSDHMLYPNSDDPPQEPFDLDASFLEIQIAQDIRYFMNSKRIQYSSKNGVEGIMFNNLATSGHFRLMSVEESKIVEVFKINDSIEAFRIVEKSIGKEYEGRLRVEVHHIKPRKRSKIIRIGKPGAQVLGVPIKGSGKAINWNPATIIEVDNVIAGYNNFISRPSFGGAWAWIAGEEGLDVLIITKIPQSQENQDKIQPKLEKIPEAFMDIYMEGWSPPEL